MATRRPTMTTVAPHPKPALSLEEWESRAPLGELETRSVSLLKAVSERSTLPVKFSVDEPGPSSRPASPSLRGNRLLGTPRPGTPVVGGSSLRSQIVASLEPKHPIQTPQQFYDWFALIDRSVTHSQEAHFRAHLANIAHHLDTCDRFAQLVDDVEQEVERMLSEWRSVEDSGKNLKDACEHMLEERDKLLAMTDSISTRLEYFQELEHATRMLNHPGESLVLQTDFLYMVERVDVCIDFLKAHRHFKEAELYLLRFQQCMTRAMTLIKMYFVGSLRALVSDVSKRISEKDVSTTAQMHLLYTRFNSVSQQLAPLLSELERRAVAHPDELSALLSECHTAYFGARKGLLVPRLVEEIKGLDPTRTELVELTRAGCSYLKQLCTDEFDLFRAFFDSSEEQLYAYLENLCDYLYDDLRPRILHEPRLTALCEVCTVLQALMVLDVPELSPSSPSSSTSSPDDDELDLEFSGNGSKHKGLGTLHISHLLQMVLQDAQTRLFFKAQSVVQSEIKYYVPKPEDLAYPDKLVDARKPVTGFEIKEKESISQLFQLKSLDKQDTWYPTLQKTVWVLSQLHEFVKPAIFDDIAQEAVNFCKQSLVVAADALKAKNPPNSTLDGQLFLVRHILILKEMTQNLDFASTKDKDSTGRIDLGGVTDTLASMLGRTTSLLPNALFASLGMPREESLTDVKHGIDHELRQACEDVINFCADSVCKPLRTWQNERITSSGTPSSTNSAPLAPPHQVLSEFSVACHRDLRVAVAKLGLYLEDDRTVAVLVKHTQERIVDEYMEFRRAVWGAAVGKEAQTGIMNEDAVRALLSEVCGGGNEGHVAGPASTSQ
ncbi:Sec34-domain-containing protein [Irpex rosettiformis]|uniref:Sec34-domain-containing protein n=1 Tax=Irpex rosettiformis TaxID=378272 RepID=A0ACB8U1E2_9APHY|nr:Sec34-domain-containing protein [Irpex rosettiformis]